MPLIVLKSEFKKYADLEEDNLLLKLNELEEEGVQEVMQFIF